MLRREFLAAAPRLAGAAALLLRPARGAEPFYTLDPADPARLKLDFNANRGKVRLLFMLSPT
ncbi:MAG: hypothetical protein DMG07_15525 [Acidobacteria bacterium]|nr:MAG: hypothetical protein DMG07_15525 [Acidobacteriota bacterium]